MTVFGAENHTYAVIVPEMKTAAAKAELYVVFSQVVLVYGPGMQEKKKLYHEPPAVPSAL